MMPRSRFLTTILLFVMTLSLSLTTPAVADWTEDFDGGLTPGVWFFQGQNRTTGTVSSTLTATSVNDVLQVSETLNSLQDGADVAFGVRTDEGFSDVLVTGNINPTNDGFTSPTLTLLARGNLLSSTFYAAEINYLDQSLVIFRGDSATAQSNLASAPLPNSLFTDDFYLEFELIGADLKATAFDTQGGTMLATASANDATLSSGISGFLIFDSFGGPLMGSYDNITSSAIVAGLACDGDGDGDCDIDDLDLLYADFGNATPANFDFDGDGAIDADDITLWLSTASDPTNTGLVNSADVLVLGDVDLNGDVDSTDLGLLLNNFSAASGVNWGDGDLDGNDEVDSTDLGLLLNNFGHSSVAASAAAVPEPSSLSLLAMALGIVMAVRRRA